jgi:pimeloyl-ACP methyl ester carboxylesterase
MARTRRAAGRVQATVAHRIFPPMPPVTERTEPLGEQPAFWRESPGGDVPVLYLHGVPNSGAMWLGFLERTGGIAPDLPGFGRSGKRGDGDFTMAGYTRWLEAFLDLAGVERVRLVVHDWGAVGLLWAMRRPERVERLVVIDAVPLLPGYRWHPLARVWRTRGAGEIAVGLNTKPLARRLAPAAIVEEAWPHFDQGTQRAILRLYRSSPEDALARAGLDLGSIDAPALVVWGERDRYIPARFADAYAQALGGDAEVTRLPDAGHWPWIERPDAIDAVVGFLGA